MESEAPLETTTLTFRKPSFWSSGMIFAAVIGALSLTSLRNVSSLTAPDVIAVAVFVGATALALLWRRLRLPKVVPPLQLSRTGLVLPRAVDSGHAVTVDYRDLRALSLRQRGAAQMLVLETTRGLFMYPSTAFDDPNGIERFLVALRERVGAIPESAEVMARMQKREELIRRVLNVRPVATYGILAALTAGLAVQVFTNSIADSGDFLRLIALGANVPTLVRSGEWWRLLSASFLHASFFHVFLNGLMLIMIGQIVERIIGPWRAIAVYVVACAGGALVSALASRVDVASVGASTGIFGLLGALAVCNWHYRRELALGFKQPAEIWVFNLVLNLALPLFIRFIDVWGHFGGFIAGALTTYVLIGRETELVYSRPADIVTRVFTSICGAAVVAALLLAAHSFATQTPDRLLSVAKTASEPSWMNAVAWSIATKTGITDEQLREATAVAERAVSLCDEKDPTRGVIRDTYATLLYRQARFDDALDNEDKALREVQPFVELTSAPADLEISSQMARFLVARQTSAGVRSSGAIPSEVSVDMVGQGLRVHLEREMPNGFMLYGVLKRGSAYEGLVRVTLGATQARQLEHTIPLKSAIVHGIDALKNPQDLTIVTAWLDANDCRCETAAYDVRFWPHDTSVDAYP